MSSQITVPAAARSVISATPKTTFKVGTYTALTDTFTSVLDLNDHVNYWLVSADLAQPTKVYSRSTTIRAQGERIANWNYGNRHIKLTIQLLYEAGTQQLLAAVRALLAAIENPPYRLAFAAPNSTVLTYADVVAVTSTIPYDGQQIMAQTLTKISIDFECAPGFAGDRITLSNLVINPGFEAPSGPSVVVFADTFANANAYTLQFGSAPTISANQMTVAANSAVLFGSPSWGAIAQWRLRWRWNTGLTAYLHLHYTDGNNWLAAVFDGVNMSLIHAVGGTQHTLATAAATLGTGGWYWLSFTQFPSAPGTQADVVATLYNDSSGTVGAQVATTGTVATFDGVTALSGHSALQANGAVMLVGGAFSNVDAVALFGPGGWGFAGFDTGATGEAAGGWEQNTANTYPGGAVTSYGAARIDAAPAGALAAYWDAAGGFSPLAGNLTAIPATTGQVLTASAQVKTSGFGASAQVTIFIIEYDVNGSGLRSTTTSLTGNQAAWATLSVTATLGASTAYVSVRLAVKDTTTGSAGGTAWFDNVQCWNQTTTGQSVMSYCELRFTQSPAQLLLTGLQGDMVAPAFTALGAYKASFGTQHTIFAVLGSKLTPVAAARLVGPALTSQWGTLAPTLDSSQLGGYYWTDTDTQAPGSYPTFMYAFSDSPAHLAGIYHLYERLWTTNNNFGAIGAQATTIISTGLFDPGYPTYVQRRSFVQGANVNPLLATNNWNVCDIGQVAIPPFGQDALLDNSQNDVAIAPYWTDPNGNSYSYRHTWQALIPVDGSVLLANLVNGTTSQPTAAPWKWFYSDGLAQSLGYEPSWHYSLEANQTPNPGAGVGGIGNTSNHAPSINPLADAYLLLDPNQSSNGVSGVAQLAGFMTDDNPMGTVLPLFAEMQYTPLYLYPRQQ